MYISKEEGTTREKEGKTKERAFLIDEHKEMTKSSSRAWQIWSIKENSSQRCKESSLSLKRAQAFVKSPIILLHPRHRSRVLKNRPCGTDTPLSKVIMLTEAFVVTAYMLSCLCKVPMGSAESRSTR
ncbi:hypothetical protein KCU81_g213, partial [Aureobasidium melanogenum]